MQKAEMDIEEYEDFRFVFGTVDVAFVRNEGVQVDVLVVEPRYPCACYTGSKKSVLLSEEAATYIRGSPKARGTFDTQRFRWRWREELAEKHSVLPAQRVSTIRP